MAPFTPFICELMYQNLRRALPDAPESVHWCDYPQPPSAQVRLPFMQLVVQGPASSTGPVVMQPSYAIPRHMQGCSRHQLQQVALCAPGPAADAAKTYSSVISAAGKVCVGQELV